MWDFMVILLFLLQKIEMIEYLKDNKKIVRTHCMKREIMFDLIAKCTSKSNSSFIQYKYKG